MTIRSFFTYSFAAIAAVAIAACAPDDPTAPRRLSQPKGTNADISALTTEPVLYSQTSLTPAVSAFNSSADVATLMADDFVVPDGQVWTVTAVSLSGNLIKETLPFSIRSNDGVLPGGILPNADYSIAPTASDPNDCACAWPFLGRPIMDYLFPLPAPLVLTAGRYWLTEQDAPAGGPVTFYWQDHSPISGLHHATWGSGGRERWNNSANEDNAFAVFGTVRLTQTITFPAISPNPDVVGGAATLGATASSALAVTYSSLTLDVCTVNNGVVSYIAAGLCTIAADQTGDAAYVAAARATQSVTVNKIAQNVRFTTLIDFGYLNGTYTPRATGGASGNPVVVTAGPSYVCTTTGGTVNFVGLGACTVALNQAGNDIYEPAPMASQIVKVDYKFTGFQAPVKSNGDLTTENAGKSIPLKWRITDANDVPITTLASATITVTGLSCPIGAKAIGVDTQTITGSQLQNLGNGNYQLDWKSSASYARSCRLLKMDLGEGDGAIRVARFEFSK